MLKRLYSCLMANISGATSIEYGLIVMGVGVVVFAALSLVSGDISSAFDYLSNSFQSRAL